MRIADINVPKFVHGRQGEKHIVFAHAHSLKEYKPGVIIHVNDTMQQNYRYQLTEKPGENFDERFKPELAPMDMLKLGVFEGKYCRDCNNEFPHEWFDDAKFSTIKAPSDSANRFAVKSRSPLSVWQENGWINKVDPRGWFQWYMRYYLGRRIPHYDDAQISRWKSFYRHVAQIKANCKPGDTSCRPRQRQAILQWAYDPTI